MLSQSIACGSLDHHRHRFTVSAVTGVTIRGALIAPNSEAYAPVSTNSPPAKQIEAAVAASPAPHRRRPRRRPNHGKAAAALQAARPTTAPPKVGRSLRTSTARNIGLSAIPRSVHGRFAVPADRVARCHRVRPVTQSGAQLRRETSRTRGAIVGCTARAREHGPAGSRSMGHAHPASPRSLPTPRVAASQSVAASRRRQRRRRCPSHASGRRHVGRRGGSRAAAIACGCDTQSQGAPLAEHANGRPATTPRHGGAVSRARGAAISVWRSSGGPRSPSKRCP
jgi:hypothetical protein